VLCRVKPIKDVCEPLRMPRLDTALTPIIEKVLKTFVGEAGDHGTSVTRGVTFDKGKAITLRGRRQRGELLIRSALYLLSNSTARSLATTSTVVVSNWQTNLLVSALTMPRDASMLFEYTQGSPEIT
jgi:hypothetical protein